MITLAVRSGNIAMGLQPHLARGLIIALISGGLPLLILCGHTVVVYGNDS